jgi:hypothetical protein
MRFCPATGKTMSITTSTSFNFLTGANVLDTLLAHSAFALEIFCGFGDSGGFGAHGEKCADEQDSGAD